MIDLTEMIQEFLKEKAPTGYDWPDVERKDTEQLSHIIHALIRAKWHADSDGDYPVQFELIDRTRYEGCPYLHVRYWHEAQTEQERSAIILALMGNVSIAMHRLDVVLKSNTFSRKDL